jgi:ammonium transporter Rh
MLLEEKTCLFLFCLQVLGIILFGLFTDYSSEASGSSEGFNSNTISKYYPFFQDVHVMIFIGFGFLMSYLHKYNFNSVVYNFLIGALCIQYTILINGFFHCVFHDDWSHKITLDIQSLITGDFGAGAVLITFGALLGKTNILEMSIIFIFELIFYSINESICVIEYDAIDMGGSMYVHTFGAYFGLAISWVISNREKLKRSNLCMSTRESDLFAMIGTLFLWMFWPSFNGALAVGNAQHRVVINTVLSLTNSCISAVIVSKLLRKGHRLSMVDIQNASLAGGVAVGSSSDLVIGPYASLIIGALAGGISVIGYIYISPFLESRLGLHDTCGVHNLHGIPGIIGGLSGVITSRVLDDNLYGDSISKIFPARGLGRSGEGQALYQLYALLTTLVIAIVGGLLTGKLVKSLNINNMEYGKDSSEWEEEEDIKGDVIKGDDIA